MQAEEYGRVIGEALATRIGGAAGEELQAFAEAFWLGVAPDELAGRTLDGDLALTEDAWKALQQFDPAQPVVAVQPGISNTRQSLVRILQSDMPFITDSVLIELGRDDVALHYLHNVTLNVQRDGSRRFGGLAREGDGLRETLIYAEIDALDTGERRALETRLQDVLADVAAAVRDYPLMRERAERLASQLAANDNEQDREAAAFLQWLADDHFTFLGFRSFHFDDGHIEQEPDSALGTMTQRAPASRRPLTELRQETRDFLLEPTRLSFSKAGTLSRVHRPAYPDYIGVKRYGDDGRVIGEDGFLGLYTSPVYTDQPRTIPIVRRKVDNVLARSGYDRRGFDGKALAQVLATFPRDELFQMPEDVLFETATAVAHLHSRRCTRLFIRRGRYGMFFNCLVYLPRDLLHTRVRMAIANLLAHTLQAEDVEFDSYFSESVLVRLQFILRVDPMAEIPFDRDELEAKIVALSRDWSADLVRALAEQDRVLVARFRDAFPADYREQFDIQTALYDVGHLSSLQDPGDLALRFYRQPDADAECLQLKLFHNGGLLSLSRVLPMLENLGFQVLSEHPYRIETDAGVQTIQDFSLHRTGGLDLSAVGDRFEQAFIRIWHGRAENDRFNGLVLAADLNWREVSLFRAYARYMKQARFNFEQTFIADTLLAHPRATRYLISHFHSRLHPEEDLPEQGERLETYLQDVASLNEDRVLRRYLEAMDATLRTSYFQLEPEADADEFIALKLDSRRIAGLPEPIPAFEIFVYAPDMEGVHLRSSAVARGGIRWSDRQEDFRTEILGLVKAQIVKNAVIVPSGAKGGFVLKRSTADLTRDELQAEGVRCYRKFIGALLSITDNLKEGATLPPPNVRRRDGDDPYLVVAADKGTAAFSDIANGIAMERGFWLGDAFASGGSVGYDHKKLGITARGAWVSVRRHFQQLGLDPEADPVTAVGIGDMGGDVFGNGLLRSRTIRLVGAFNHAHIFIDPNPDAAAAFEERARLFVLPRSSWSDYDPARISAGGGIFARSQKAIAITPEMAERFEIDADSLTPDELIMHLLRAPVDLLWNGGIGTYVKAATETHEQVGDRSNDSVRVDGAEVRARVVGEGGNLGFTHRGRIEYAQHGGAIFADFIDNAAGVDCSDHEVNAKILLAGPLASGQLTPAARDTLLMNQADAVADLVLVNNFVQARALTLAVEHAHQRSEEYERLAHRLEEALGFNRREAAFPTTEVLRERARAGQGLTGPELSTLLGYSKILLKSQLADADLHEDPVIRTVASREFPDALLAPFSSALGEHRLLPDIVTTLVANEIIGLAGMTFVNRIMEFVGCQALEVVRGYWVSAQLLGLSERFDIIDASGLAPEDRCGLLLEVVRLVRRMTRWLIREHRGALDVAALLERYQGFFEAAEALPREVSLSQQQLTRYEALREELEAAGMTPDEARRHAPGFSQFQVLAIAEVCAREGVTPEQAGPVYVALGARLGIDALTEQLTAMTTVGHWRAMERDALLDDLCERQLSVTQRVLASGQSLDDWWTDNASFLNAWDWIVREIKAEGDQEFASISMTVRKLVDLARAEGY